jgi:hypothetical protein
VLSVLVADVPDMDERYRRILPDVHLVFARTLPSALSALNRGSHSLLIVGMNFDESRMFELLSQVKPLPSAPPVVCVRECRILSDLNAAHGVDVAVRELGAREFLDLRSIPDDDDGNARVRARLLSRA